MEDVSSTCCSVTAAPAPTGNRHLSVTALLKSAAYQQGGTTSIHSPLLLLPAYLPLLLYIPGRAESPLAPPKPPSPPQELQHLQIPSSPFWVLALRFQNLLFLPHPLLHPWPLNTPQHPEMDGPRSTTLAPTQLQFGYLLHKPDELKTRIKKQNVFFPHCEVFLSPLCHSTQTSQSLCESLHHTERPHHL